MVVTSEMGIVRHTADRVVMLFPLAQLGKDEGEVIFDGPAVGWRGLGMSGCGGL